MNVFSELIKFLRERNWVGALIVLCIWAAVDFVRSGREESAGRLQDSKEFRTEIAKHDSVSRSASDSEKRELMQKIDELNALRIKDKDEANERLQKRLDDLSAAKGTEMNLRRARRQTTTQIDRTSKVIDSLIQQ